MKNVIRKVTAQEAKLVYNSHEFNKGAVVIRYKPYCLLDNSPVYATVAGIHEEDSCSWITTDVDGAEINFSDIIEWLIVEPTEENIAFRRSIDDSLSNVKWR